MQVSPYLLHDSGPRGPRGLWDALAVALSNDAHVLSDDVEIDLDFEERAHLGYLARVAGPHGLDGPWADVRSA
jgi:hypothetical protein